MTTATLSPLSAEDLRTGLQELHELVEQYAALEARIESKALELELRDMGDEFHTPHARRYFNALAGALVGIYREANVEKRESDWDPLGLVDDIEAAIEIIDLAVAKEGDDGR